MSEFETIELIQPILGMTPYVLIEADKDSDDGELVLKVKAGRLPNSQSIGYIPFLMITELPAESNPLTIGIREHLADHPEHREALTAFADSLGVPMPEAVDG